MGNSSQTRSGSGSGARRRSSAFEAQDRAEVVTPASERVTTADEDRELTDAELNEMVGIQVGQCTSSLILFFFFLLAHPYTHTQKNI